VREHVQSAPEKARSVKYSLRINDENHAPLVGLIQKDYNERAVEEVLRIGVLDDVGALERQKRCRCSVTGFKGLTYQSVVEQVFSAHCHRWVR
jgi:hypothetical protein